LEVPVGSLDITLHRDDLADVRAFPQVPFLDRLRPAESSQSPSAAVVSLNPWGGFSRLAAALGLPQAGPLTMPFPHTDQL
jgi:hypothetical protein